MGPEASRFQELRELEVETLRRREQVLARELEDLQHAATQLISADGVKALYAEILNTAIAIVHSDCATIQSFHPEHGTNGDLRLLDHRGLTEAAADSWKTIDVASGATCGEALRTGKRVAVRDLREGGFMAGSPDLQGYLDLGIVGAQTTPLYSRSGSLLGMVSTYWRHPHELTASESRALDVLARLAADLLERSRAEEHLRESEERLRQSEERLRLAIKATNDAVWDVDLKAGTVSWNETYTSIYGRPDTASSSEWWVERIHPDDRERVATDFWAAISGTASSWNAEYRFRRLDDRWAYVYDRAYIARDSSGKAWRVIGALQDLTIRKEAEVALRESEALFRKMADAAPVMIWGSGPDKLCTFFNTRWLEFRGRSMEQELGNGWAEGVHPEDRDRCYGIYASAFDQRRSFQMEYRLLRSDGEHRSILDTGVPVFTSAGVFEGYIGSCVDITDLKRAQEENFHRQKLESIGVLAAGIAHDFNNLLGGILAQAQLVEDELPVDGPLVEDVQKIRTLGVRASEIVRELMVYAGQEKNGFETVDLSTLVIEMLELLKISMSKRAVLKTSLDTDLPAIQAQASQIRQIVMNLVTNAAEAVVGNDGVISVTTRLDPSAAGFVCLEVSDTGCGMTEEQQAKIFDPFFTTKFAGRGLGLAVVQGVVRTHGGSIALESSPGRGTTFRIFLPIAGQSAEPHGETELAEPAKPLAATPHAVLLVEDEETLRHAVARMLRKRGFTVLEAADGVHAIEFLRDQERRVDVILLDLTIPGIDSREVMEQALRIRPQTRIVLTSAYSRDTGFRFDDVLQVVGFIRKPFRADDLADLLAKAAAPPGASA